MLHHGPVLIVTRPDELIALAALVDAGHRARQRNGMPNSRLQDQITTDIITAYRTVTAAGQTDVPTTPEMSDCDADDHLTLTTGEVAAVLGLSPRHARRLADSLGARKRGGTLQWPAHDVYEYSEFLKGTAA